MNLEILKDQARHVQFNACLHVFAALKFIRPSISIELPFYLIDFPKSTHQKDGQQKNVFEYIPA